MKHWDRHSQTDQDAFLVLITPLVAAAGSRAREWHDKGSAKTQRLAWMIAFADVPREVLEEAIDRKLRQGVGWMPSHEEMKHLCCDIVDERRREAAKRAKALGEDCARCDGTQWEGVKDDAGIERMKRCWCFTRGLELITEAGQALSRPALPPSSEPNEAA